MLKFSKNLHGQVSSAQQNKTSTRHTATHLTNKIQYYKNININIYIYNPPLPSSHTHIHSLTHSRTHRHARNTKPPLADTRTGTQGTAQPNTEQDDTQEDETNKDEEDTKQPRKKQQMMTEGKRTETQRHTEKQLEFLRCPAVVWSSGRAARARRPGAQVPDPVPSGLVPGGFCRVRSTSQMVNHIND